jgi:ComF family protein
MRDSQRGLCRACESRMPYQKPPFCLRCGVSYQGGITGYCGDACEKNIYAFDRAFGACRYEAPLVEYIHLFKYRRNIWLAKPFVSIMEAFFCAHMREVPVDIITSAPTTAVRVRERIYDQAHLLARGLAQRLKLPYAHHVIKKVPCDAQTHIASRARRHAQIQGTMRIGDRHAVRGRAVLLVDDVFTTGATTDEASKLLKDAGARTVTVFTLART